MRRNLLGLLALILIMLPTACSQESTVANQQPVVEWVERPAEGETRMSAARFRWTGIDPDGTVDHFEHSLDSDTEWTRTTVPEVVLEFTKADGTESMPAAHVFRVRAVDNQGLMGEHLAAGFLVAVFNDPPQAAFTNPPPTDIYLGSQVTLSWEASDSDGTVTGYEYAVNDTAAGWIDTSETSVTLDLSGDTPAPAPRGLGPAAHEPERYTFFLRAVDNEGKRSSVISTDFISGPENQPPVLTLTRGPVAPVFFSPTEFAWTGEDPDGAILGYQWAVDLETPADWIPIGTTTSVLVAFTRDDGVVGQAMGHTFHLRAMDDDSLYSDPLVHDFRVSLANRPPTMTSLTAPNPATPQLYSGVTIRWTATDDVAVTGFELAFEDTLSGWTAVPATPTSYSRPWSCPDPAPYVPPANPAQPVAESFGDHVIHVRAVDDEGARSDPLAAMFRTFTRTPFVIGFTDPATQDGSVEAGSLTLAWTGLDVDGPGDRKPFAYRWIVFPVDDFADVPDARDAVLAARDTGTVVTLPEGVTTLDWTAPSSGLYVLAVWAVDLVGAEEPFFLYGRNTLKITAP